jgi:hypothetical protein
LRCTSLHGAAVYNLIFAVDEWRRSDGLSLRKMPVRTRTIGVDL